MSINLIFKYIMVCIGLFFSIHVNAVEYRNVNIFLNGPTVTGPADAGTFASTIATWGNTGYTNICSSETLNYSVGRIELTSLLPFTGRTYQPTSAHQVFYLYESGVEGLAFNPIIGGQWLQAPMGNSRSLIPGTSVVYTGNVNNNNRKTAFPSFISAGLLKDAGRILVGQTLMPARGIHRFDCYDTNNVLQEAITVGYNPYTIYSSVTSCRPNESNYLIKMKDLSLDDVERASVGTTFESVQRGFSLNCDPNINLYVTVNDLVDPTNLTNRSKLTPDSTAKGVGFQVSTNAGNLINFSPPGSTPGMASRNQLYVKRTASNNELVNFSLMFNYLKTDNEISEGKARSIIGVTYSYQ